MDRHVRTTTVLGFLGTTLDAGADAGRWSRWRPTVALCQHDDLVVSKFVLLHDPRATWVSRIVDDIRSVSPETTVECVKFPLRDPWDFEEVFAALHDFARSRTFDLEREELLVHITTGTHVAQICLFLLCESRHLPARLIQTSPPHKSSPPPGAYQIIDLDLSRYDRIATRYAKEQAAAASLLKSGIATTNRAFNALIDRIEQVAMLSTDPLLLLGPTGAGKSQLVARIAELKRARHRLTGRFVEVNCATLRGDQAMSALFGHVKGAFTGAQSARAGLLKAADQGLLFLDEIGELGLDEQAMLLRALEEKTFLPVGADDEVRSVFQLVAGTNQDLHARVAEGRFREDLLARIDTWTFRLPGLRDRLDDVEPNLAYELDKFERSSGRRVSFNKEARERFLAFATGPTATWPGNFRDFNASILRMATLAQSGRITLDAVHEEIERLRLAWTRAPARDFGDDAQLLRRVLGDRASELDRFDAVQLAEVLRVCRSSKSLADAGRTLFASSLRKRTTTNDGDRLRKYLARFGVTYDAARG